MDAKTTGFATPDETEVFGTVIASIQAYDNAH